MKGIVVFTSVAIAALNGLILAPGLERYAFYFVSASIALALWLALRTLVAKPRKEAPAVAEPVPAAAPPPPPPPPQSAKQAEAEVLSVLGALQAKGRLIDFLMDDIGAYADAQVGAAARVVHQGCKAALDEFFTIEPVSAQKEGSPITVPQGAPADEFRLVGSVTGEPPYSGTLVHKGWKATRVKLPRVVNVDDSRLPAIAPAQVELKN